MDADNDSPSKLNKTQPCPSSVRMGGNYCHSAGKGSKRNVKVHPAPRERRCRRLGDRSTRHVVQDLTSPTQAVFASRRRAFGRKLTESCVHEQRLSDSETTLGLKSVESDVVKSRQRSPSDKPHQNPESKILYRNGVSVLLTLFKRQACGRDCV